MSFISGLNTMPDGDIVYSKLAPLFHNAYRDVCSNGFEAEDVAHEIAIPLKKTLQVRGDAPLDFLGVCFRMFQDGIPNNPGEIIDDLARQYYGDQAGIEIGRNAARRYIDDCRYDGMPVKHETLIENYVKQTYVVEFMEKIPLNVEHYNHIHSDEVFDRLMSLEPFIDQETRTFAKQIVRDKTTTNLRRRSYRVERIELHGDAY